LTLVDGYKALVRWATKSAPYVDKFEELELADGQAYHVRCWILRDDRKTQIAEWVALGAPWREAFELVATHADGVVTVNETKREPPTGWSWEQVCKKRALKNALNLSHGAPSPRDVAAMSWDVNGTKTTAADWEDIPAEIVEEGQAPQLAKMRAEHRETMTAWEQMTEEQQEAKAADNSEALYGAEDFEGFDPPPDGPTWPDIFDSATPAPDDEPLPPDFLIVKVPSGKHVGKTMAWLLQNDIDYVARIAAGATDKEIKESAIAALKWHEQEQAG